MEETLSHGMHWHSPSHVWIETGVIVAESEFFIIDTINSNLTGVIKYEHNKYMFKADDYSVDGNQLFLAKGYGRYESNSAVSW